jgi:lactate dehydrogenase-like 2-hydroxyacid dehydrogenase
MERYLLAIDVLERIPNFLATLNLYTKRPALTVSHVKDVKNVVSDFGAIEGILISIYQPLTVEFLTTFSHLRFIAILGTSTAQIPVEYCQEQGIKVFVVSEYCDVETAEWVMLKILTFFRNHRNPPASVFEKSLGIIGMGSVGKSICSLAKAFNMSVYYNSTRAYPDISAKFVDKLTIFSTCDVVTIHTPPHYAWLSRDLVKHAKPNMCLINTCMGRMSVASELEEVLATRKDVTIIMDKIAGEHYPDLGSQAIVSEEAAFSTMDSKERLIKKFFANVASFYQQ